MECRFLFAQRLLPAVLLATAFLLLPSCGDMPSTLPSAIGGVDEVIFVEDPRFSNDSLYGRVDERLRAQYGNFIHNEPTFDVLNLDLEAFSKTLTNHRNILLVGILDRESDYNDQIKRMIGQSGQEQVRGGGLFTVQRKNVWAAGQTVHVLVASDYDALDKGLDKAMNDITANIQKAEFAKIRRNMYASGQEEALSRELAEEQNIVLKIPAYYKKHPSSNGAFMWYRRSTVDLTASIMVYSHPYTRELESSPAYAIFVRDSLGRQYERSQIEGAYMTTEKLVRPLQDTVDLNGHFAIRTQSLWRLEHDFMGGPFINYLVYDKANNRIIHLDAYVYAPDITQKRRLVRELEAVLTTFGVPGEGS